MGSKPNDASNSERPATELTREPREGVAIACAMQPTRRHFIVGMSGVLVGAAACAGEDRESDEVPGAGGAPGASGAPSTSSGAPAASAGAPSSGGAPSGNAGAPPLSGGAPTVSGGAPAASGGAPTAGAPAAGGGAAAGNAGSSTSGGASAGAAGTSGAVRKTASDRVLLGSTGIEVSRLAMGSGTVGTGGRSAQSRLGVEEFSGLLVYAFEQGITFFETADAYGSHPHVAEAIRRVGRQNVVVLTKTTAETAAGVEADLARFRTELGVDMIDIVLLHLKTSRNWTAQCEGAMEVLSKAKQSGAIRAHGVSCHSIEALRLAAQTSWVDVDLARVNPAGVVMDAEPGTVIDVLREMKTGRKGVIGMKILGEGQLANRLDMAIKHAVELDAIDAFTIGFTSKAQLDEVIQKIATV